MLPTFVEAIGQLQSTDKVLCVIYDIPLPDFYNRYFADAPQAFPYAIAMILGNAEGQSYRLEQIEQVMPGNLSQPGLVDSEPLRLLRLLAGISNEIDINQNECNWRIARLES